MPAEDGKRLMHSEIQVNGARIFVMDDFPEHRGSHGVDAVFPPDQIKGTSVTMHLEVENCDAAVKRARDAGATVTLEPWDIVLGRALRPHHGPVRPFLELCARAAREGLRPAKAPTSLILFADGPGYRDAIGAAILGLYDLAQRVDKIAGQPGLQQVARPDEPAHYLRRG